jgi:hypothetical protein
VPPEHRDRSAPLLPWFRLYKRTSKAGRTDYTGALGALKLGGFEQDAADGIDAHIALHVTERGDARERPAEAATSTRSTHRPIEREQRSADPELVFD